MWVEPDAIYLRFRLRDPFETEGKVPCAYAVYRDGQGQVRFGALNGAHSRVYASVPYSGKVKGFLEAAVRQGWWVERYHYPSVAAEPVEGEGIWFNLPLTAERKMERPEIVAGFKEMLDQHYA